MNEKFDVKMQLSALVDGELEPLELRQLLKRLEAMPEQQRTDGYSAWQQYQNISQQLGSAHSSIKADADFLSKVSSAVAQIDADVGSDEMSADSASGKSLVVASSPVWAKFAVAASVALAVIVGVQQYQIDDHRESLRIAQQNAAATNRPSTPVYNSGAQFAGLKQTGGESVGVVNNVADQRNDDQALQLLEQQRLQQIELQKTQ